jgi:hypothetical protein
LSHGAGTAHHIEARVRHRHPVWCTLSAVTISLDDAQIRAAQLYKDLSRIADRDPEQEVWGIAVPVLDACLSALRAVPKVADDPVISRMPDVYSADTIAEGEPVRAVDALVVLGQIIAVIGEVQPGLGSFA